MNGTGKGDADQPESTSDRSMWKQQFLDVREALSEAGVEHIGFSIADAVRALARDRDRLARKLHRIHTLSVE